MGYITVVKQWNDRDGRVPAQVYLTLYNGQTVYQTVTLSAANNWSHTWDNLDPNGNWQVIETNIPAGYTPTYSVNGNVITVTNNETLIQTGQLDWPIVVMGGAGVLMLLCGAVMIARKRKEEDV